MQWFRMYAEFAYDAKVQCLDETLQRRYIMFLCLQCNGELAKLTDVELAFTLRITPDELSRTVDELTRARLIGSGKAILGWDRRQYKSDTSTDRVKRHRSKKQGCNVSETASNGRVTAPEAEADTERAKPRASGFQEVYDAGSDLFPNLAPANTSAIHQWLNAGCSIELDIIPELRRCAGRSPRGWGYFTGGVMDAKATREATPSPGTPRGQQRPKGEYARSKARTI